MNLSEDKRDIIENHAQAVCDDVTGYSHSERFPGLLVMEYAILGPRTFKARVTHSPAVISEQHKHEPLFDGEWIKVVYSPDFRKVSVRGAAPRRLSAWGTAARILKLPRR